MFPKIFLASHHKSFITFNNLFLYKNRDNYFESSLAIEPFSRLVFQNRQSRLQHFTH